MVNLIFAFLGGKYKVIKYKTTCDYLNYIMGDFNLESDASKNSIIKNFLDSLANDLYDRTNMVSNENFWEVLSICVQIDSKIALIKQLINVNDLLELSEDEIVNLVNKEFILFNHENAGYTINEDSHRSLIFC